MEVLEKSHSWKEPDFDTVLQYLRTILLRRMYSPPQPIATTCSNLLDGASLIYTSQHSASQLPTLIHSTLGITSLLKKQPLKHNVIDRDKIVVPPNWDSWGKIRVLGGNFVAESVSQGWAEDIDERFASGPIINLETLETNRNAGNDEDDAVETTTPAVAERALQTESALAQYENWCQDPESGGVALVDSVMTNSADVNVVSDETQKFLEGQLKLLDTWKAQTPEKTALEARDRAGFQRDREAISEHIGPVQFNVGGIHVDADDMLQRIKVLSTFPKSSVTRLCDLSIMFPHRAIFLTSHAGPQRIHLP